MALASVAGEKRVEALGRCGWRRRFRIGVLIAAVFAAMGLAVACVEPLSGTCAELRTCADASQDRSVSIEAAPDAGTDRAAVEGSPALDAGPDVALDVGPDLAIDRFVCDATMEPKDEPCVLDESFGVFVAAPLTADGGDASAGGDGSKSKPYATIGQALTNLGGKTRVYVCNGSYQEQVAITSPVEIYGGLSCAPAVDGGMSWSYVGGSAQVTAQSSAYALSVTGVGQAQDAGFEAGVGDAGLGGAVTISDVSFRSPNAGTAGGSSIAAMVTASSVHLVRVTLTAGTGADGAPGADGVLSPNYLGAAPNGAPQVVDNRGFSISGGAGGVNACMGYGNSAGGAGGTGCSVGAGFGAAGSSSPVAPITMAGRDGLPRGAMLPDGGVATTDDPGADGVGGRGGAPATGYGVLSPSGWTPSAGGDGEPGKPGQGGAGGSDPLANMGCSAPVISIGGGGGGSGGCGGAGGQGGRGGGASIALASIASTVDLQACVLAASSGGAGAAGGTGQDGQSGGVGSDNTTTANLHAPGAAGGNGAGGSGGAGGTGGLSVGVLYQGSTITSDMATNQAIRLGPPGAAGAAGVPGKHSTAGVFLTGMDGNPGLPGGAGTSVSFLKLM
jgi:hypothetical protein